MGRAGQSKLIRQVEKINLERGEGEYNQNAHTIYIPVLTCKKWPNLTNVTNRPEGREGGLSWLLENATIQQGTQMVTQNMLRTHEGK